MKRLFLILIFTFSINSVFADSPLTSSVFYQAYLDMPIGQEAIKSKGKVTDEIWVFILDDMNPLHVKLAIINSQGLTAYGEYCYASKLFLEIKSNTNIVMDMRIEALSYIFEYMISVSENCKTNNFYK